MSVSREAIAHRLPPPPPGLVYNEVLPVARLLHNDQPASKGMCRLLASVNDHLSRDDHDNLKRAVGDVAGGEPLDGCLVRALLAANLAKFGHGQPGEVFQNGE